jgi:hypothetical protein
MSGKWGGNTEATIRYYGGIEDAYNGLRHLAKPVVVALYDDSPYSAGFDVIAPEDAFFAAGYVVSDFPSLYDMFGKFMAGLDIEVLRSQIQLDFIRGTVSEELKTTNRINENYDTDTVILPKLKASMQNMNAVMSSSFIDAQTTVYSNMEKRINTYNANIDMKLLDNAIQWASKHLEWNVQVISSYNKIINDYLTSNANYLSSKASVVKMDKLWPFTVFDQYRAIVGCLNGAAAAQNTKDPGWSRAVSGAVGTASFLASPTGQWVTNSLGITGGDAVGAGATTSQIMDSSSLASEAAGWEAFAA